MSSIKEILEKERENVSRIYLYREGLFYKAYERSAYLWTQKVCHYEVKVRHVKAVDVEVMSIGFPASVLERKLNGCCYDKDGENVIVEVGGGIVFDEVAYRQWRSGCKAASVTGGVVEKSVCIRDEIVGRIMNFPIESSSPIECMVFLSELKRQCQSGKENGDIHQSAGL